VIIFGAFTVMHLFAFVVWHGLGIVAAILAAAKGYAYADGGSWPSPRGCIVLALFFFGGLGGLLLAFGLRELPYYGRR